MILLIDNYDSFAYNLYQLIGTINSNIRVIRNDETDVGGIEKLRPSHIVISPGPGRPGDAGICPDVVKELSGKFPLLGVCLGMQIIFEACGGTVTYAKQLMHGKESEIELDETCAIFRGLGRKITAARYHSLAADQATMPPDLIVTARDADGEIMAVSHRRRQVYGVQFHPESILTPHGEKILENFLA